MKKIETLRTKLDEHGIECALITSPNNIFYLLEYAPNQLSVSLNNNIATLFISSDRAVLITMDYEAEFIKQQLDSSVEVISYPTWTGIGEYNDYLTNRTIDTSTSVVSTLKTLITTTTIGVEKQSISYEFLMNFNEYETTDITSILLAMRMIKTPEEIATFKKLCKIQSNALKTVAHNIKEGISELELYEIYKQQIDQSNYCYISHWTMLCSGHNSSYLSTPTTKKIGKNDIIKFDGGVNLGFKYFTTDMSRSFIVGTNQELAKIKSVLVDAQQLIINNMRPGVTCSSLFEIGFNHVKKYYPGYVRGHLGHSISFGPSTFEPPFINPNDHTVLKPGMILCIEVPMYIANLGGMNIEDMVLVTEDGCEVLTRYVDHYEYENISNNNVL